MNRHTTLGRLARWLAFAQAVLIVAMLAVPIAVLADDPAGSSPPAASSEPTSAPAAEPTPEASPDQIVKNDVGDKGTGNAGDGIKVGGNTNSLSENNVFANTGAGLLINGNSNTLNKNDVGDGGKGNGGDGINLTGNGNTLGKDLNENDVYANGGNGIAVTGNNNTLLKNDVGDRGKGNGGDGFHIVGYGNTLTENNAFANGGDGFDISGSTSAKPNVLLKNNSGANNAGNGGNGFLIAGTGNGLGSPVEIDQNTAKANKLYGFSVTGTGFQLSKNQSGGSAGGSDDNLKFEFKVVAGNFNMTGNKANTTTVAGASGSAFPTAGQGTGP